MFLFIELGILYPLGVIWLSIILKPTGFVNPGEHAKKYFKIFNKKFAI
jgi:hypothetical protein